MVPRFAYSFFLCLVPSSVLAGKLSTRVPFLFPLSCSFTKSDKFPSSKLTGFYVFLPDPGQPVGSRLCLDHPFPPSPPFRYNWDLSHWLPVLPVKLFTVLRDASRTFPGCVKSLGFVKIDFWYRYRADPPRPPNFFSPRAFATATFTDLSPDWTL